MKASKILESFRLIIPESLPLNRKLSQAYNEYGEDALISFLDSTIRSVAMGSRLKAIVNWRLNVKSNVRGDMIVANLKGECNLIPNRVITVSINFNFNPFEDGMYLTGTYRDATESIESKLLWGRKWEADDVYLANVATYVQKWLKQSDKVLFNDIQFKLKQL